MAVKLEARKEKHCSLGDTVSRGEAAVTASSCHHRQLSPLDDHSDPLHFT